MIAMRRRRDPLNHGPTQTSTDGDVTPRETRRSAWSALVRAGPWFVSLFHPPYSAAIEAPA